MTAAAGLFGKHPAFGDFIAAGDLSADLMRGATEWLASTLSAWRDAVGPGWEQLFAAAPPLRFWVGPAIAGGHSLRGVLAPSRDRTGRRFPLVVAQAPGGAGPFADADPAFYDSAVAALERLAATVDLDPRAEAAALAGALPEAETAPEVQSDRFWALNPALDAAALFADLATTEHLHARAGRSYWWFSGSGTGMLACPGWPDPVQFGWLLARGQGLPQDAPQHDEAAPC